MLRISRLVSGIGLPLLLAACGEDSAPPSEPGKERTQGRGADVSATAVDRSRSEIRQTGANAVFSSIDPSGCVETFVFVLGAEQAQKEGPGKPTTAPLAIVEMSEFNFCTGELVREIIGTTDDATFQAGRKLTEARLQTTISAFDFVNEVEVQVVVDLAWTGAGELVSLSDRFRQKAPGILLNLWLKGTFRQAEVSGTVIVEGENVATEAVAAEILRARSGFMEMVRTR